RTLPEPTDVARRIYATACALYEGSGLDSRARLRLVGVRASGLAPAAGAASQLAFWERARSWREAERAMDRIAGRFGTDTIRPAALVLAPGDDPLSASPGGTTPQAPAAGHDPEGNSAS
ncbi:MAG TPA: hypothetical protein VE343_11940, partial [Streptosporangiaceae bacterium]|nr:hypothetical protein [Streptosporangiaceae bacterium]